MDDYGEFIEPCGPIDYEVEAGEIRDIVVPWAIDLDGDEISASTFELDGLTEDSNDFDATSATVFIDFDDARQGWTYCITNTITTTGGRRYIKRLRIRILTECLC